MAVSIDIRKVSIVSIFVECILYGFFTFMFAVSIYVLLVKRRNRKERVNRPLVIVSMTMFTLATVHIGADLQRLLRAFLNSDNAEEYLSLVNDALYSVKSTAYAAQTLVGDGFMLYRLFLIWAGDKRICTPILITFIASIGVAIGSLQAFARASPSAPIFTSELQKWIVSFFTLTLFTNFACTHLIALRIFLVHRRTAGLRVGGSSMFPAAMIIVESGVIYTVCLVILLSLYLAGSFAKDIVLDSITPVIGIVFSLIIVRVGLGLSAHATILSTRPPLSTFSAPPPPFDRVNGNSHGNNKMQTQSLRISRLHKQNSALTSTSSDTETNIQGGEFVVLDGRQACTTASSATALGKPESQKESSDSYTNDEISFHPFDNLEKPEYTIENVGHADAYELHDQIRVTRTIEQHTV